MTWRRGWAGELAAGAAAPLCLLLVLFLVPPTGRFPVADDWDYAATVRDLLRFREIRLSDWPAMTLLGHIVWGACFAQIFGFSRLSLQASTFVTAGVAAAALYGAMRLVGRGRLLAVFGSLAFVFCPLTLCFSYSFMTDVPAAAWMMILAVVQVFCSRSRNALPWALLGALTALAYLVRQTAILPTLVFAAFSLRRLSLAPSLAFIIPMCGAVVAHYVWLHQLHGAPYFATQPLLRLSLLGNRDEALGRIAQVLFGVGFYLAPVVCCWLNRESGKSFWRSRSPCVAASIALFAMTGLVLTAGDAAKPYCNDAVFDFGLGADSTIPGRNDLLGPDLAFAGARISLFRCGTTITAIAAVTLLAGIIFLPGGRAARPAELIFQRSLSASVFLLTALCLVTTSFYERYLIPITALGGLALLGRNGDADPRSPGLVAWGVLALFALFAVFGMQDYLLRNTVAWEAIALLESRGVGVEEINGGFEFSGERRFNPHYRNQPERVPPYLAAMSPETRTSHLATYSPFYHYLESRLYTISFVPLPRTVVEQRLPYRSWMRAGELLILRRGE